jgi:hypothetical protein
MQTSSQVHPKCCSNTLTLYYCHFHSHFPLFVIIKGSTGCTSTHNEKNSKERKKNKYGEEMPDLRFSLVSHKGQATQKNAS